MKFREDSEGSRSWGSPPLSSSSSMCVCMCEKRERESRDIERERERKRERENESAMDGVNREIHSQGACGWKMRKKKERSAVMQREK